MGIQLINIGFGNIVAANRIVAIVSPESAPIKRMVQEAFLAGSLRVIVATNAFGMGVDKPDVRQFFEVDPKDIKQIGVLDALIVYSQGQGLFEKEMEFIIRGLELQPMNQTFLGMQVVLKWCTGGYW